MHRIGWLAASALVFNGVAEAKLAPAAAPALQCPATLPAGLQCASGPRGVAVSGTGEDAERFLSAIMEGADRFEQHFGKKVSPAALVEPSDRFDALRPALKSRVAFPWVKFKEDMVDASIERVKAAQPNLSEEQINKIRKTQFQQAQLRELGAVSHEFCHLWLIRDFGFSENQGVTNRHYGGSAPDWLDETAAVLCENETLIKDRRSMMRMLRKGALPWKLVPLQAFTTMAHPLAQREQELLKSRPQAADAAAGAQPEKRGEGYFRRLTGDEAQAFIGDTNAPGFYVQARVFADFLIEKSGRPDIFAGITAAALKGRSYEAWLAKNGKKNNLPSTMEELQTQWDAWLDTNYPKA